MTVDTHTFHCCFLQTMLKLSIRPAYKIVVNTEISWIYTPVRSQIDRSALSPRRKRQNAGFFRRERQNAVFLVSLASLSEEIILRCDILNTRCASFKIKNISLIAWLKSLLVLFILPTFTKLKVYMTFKIDIWCDNIKSNW